MKLHVTQSFRFSGQGSIQGLPIPFRYERDGKIFEITEIDTDGKSGRGFSETTVDPSKLEKIVINHPEPVEHGIHVPERDELREFVKAVRDAITFSLDVSITTRPTNGQLIPETDGDEKKLKGFGTTDLFYETFVNLHQRAFQIDTLTPAMLTKLLDREVGIATLVQAMAMQNPAARYRELWRVLESAFREKSDKLAKLLAQFEPVKKMGFTEEHLHDLTILRHRASHLYSKAGIAEFRRANADVEDVLWITERLAEMVLLTKKNWGSNDLETDSLPLHRDYSRDMASTHFG